MIMNDYDDVNIDVNDDIIIHEDDRLKVNYA